MKPEATQGSSLGLGRSTTSLLHRMAVSPTVIKFVIVGGIGYLVNQFILFLLYDSPLATVLPAKGSHLNLIFVTHSDARLFIASAVALEAAILSNFLWHENWTFRHRDRRRWLPLRFLTFNGTSFGSPVISFATINILTPTFGISPYIANTIGICVGASWNWTMNSMFIWPRASGEQAEAGGRVSAWRPLLPPQIKQYVSPYRLSMAVTLLFFAVTLLVYSAVNPGRTPFISPVLLADAMLHGRLDIANGPNLPHIDWSIYQDRYYIVEPPMTALVVLPGVLLFGLALNQTLVSVVIGAINAAAVHRLVAGLREKISTQIWLTALFVFGTPYWWNASNGGVWYFAHVVQVLFLVFAVYETLVGKRPFTAGMALGAASLSRLPTLLALPFFLIMFSERWLPPADRPLLRRVDPWPLILFGAGLGIFGALGAAYNFLAFDTPLPASYHYWQTNPTLIVPGGLLDHGLFDVQYFDRHLPVIFRDMPVIRSEAPYVQVPQGGMAVWAATPAVLYGFFAAVRGRRTQVVAGALLAAGLLVALVFTRGLPDWITRFSREFPDGLNLPYDLEFMPFVGLTALAVWTGFRSRNKLVLACWAAIIPMALLHFGYAITGWPQFGYRFALDYLPFVFLLVMVAMGDDLRWHHKGVIALSVAINIIGVLWWYEFAPNQTGGLEWLVW